MADIFALRAQRQNALDKADSILKAIGNGQSTREQSLEIDNCMTIVAAINPQIKKFESNNSILKQFPGGQVLVDGGSFVQRDRSKVTLTQDYSDGFAAYIASGGQNISAALYEGSSPAGGYAVPIVVDDQIVPLAPQEMAVRRTSMVLATSMDIKVPRKGAFGVASAKAENSSFTEIDPTLEQFTLSAFMSGIQETISWELAQDVPSFQNFCVTDMILAVQMFEENLYVNGTGSGQAQGLLGNVQAGYGPQEADTNGNLVTITGILNLIGTLNEVYHPNASFLMTRATSIIIRKAQTQANLYNPAWTRVGTQDYLFGYPVFYSSSMPAATRGNSPVLFGDFKMGYVIGDRGGAGINVKVLDQPAAQQGQIILLAYRRTDGRVRRSEAIQTYEIAAS